MAQHVATMQLVIQTTACESHELHREVQVLEIRRADETVVIANQKVPLMPALAGGRSTIHHRALILLHECAQNLSWTHSLWIKSRATVACVHQALSVQVAFSDEFMAQWLWNGFVKSPSHRGKRDNYCGQCDCSHGIFPARERPKALRLLDAGRDHSNLAARGTVRQQLCNECSRV